MVKIFLCRLEEFSAQSSYVGAFRAKGTGSVDDTVLSFKLLGLTICHDLSWETHISNLASKASRRLGILPRAKSFLGPPELLTMYKAFVRSLMEYCSPLWAGAPAFHLSRLHAMETKAFRIISSNEAVFGPLTLSSQAGQ